MHPPPPFPTILHEEVNNNLNESKFQSFHHNNNNNNIIKPILTATVEQSQPKKVQETKGIIEEEVVCDETAAIYELNSTFKIEVRERVSSCEMVRHSKFIVQF
jgi:hypothetical protein